MIDLYALVDINTLQIITPLSKLPKNWSNVSGLNFFDDDKLSDLSWAGHDNLGWFSYKNEGYTFSTSANWMDSSKLTLNHIFLQIEKKRLKRP